jgi:hypothetical protein
VLISISILAAIHELWVNTYNKVITFSISSLQTPSYKSSSTIMFGVARLCGVIGNIGVGLAGGVNVVLEAHQGVAGGT